jgi:flagellar biosynthesis protein FliQ
MKIKSVSLLNALTISLILSIFAVTSQINYQQAMANVSNNTTHR